VSPADRRQQSSLAGEALIPPRLREALQGEFEAPTLTLAKATSTILRANEMPFFPGYTDHGVDHVNGVMRAIERLVPEEVWEQGLLTSSDAAILVGASLIHDLALHLHEDGFLQLVSEDSPYKPAIWFRDDHAGRAADPSWTQLWRDFQQEARHFGTSHLELILGPSEGAVPSVAHEMQLQPARWKRADRLLIGEFLRRHHARLSHEIALYGFPGAGGDFPVAGKLTPRIGNAIGLVARSHGESLRQILKCLDYLEPGNKQPSGAFLAYHMCLLRIADYLQVDADRAPPLLLRLKSPLSPLSVEEWNKHGAVASVAWSHDDPLAIYVTVLAEHGLRAHLTLKGLFEDIQREMDTAAAVLSEIYVRDDLASLRLSRQRLLSNIDEPSLHDQLPYLPTRAALHSDPDLFRLVIRDLYGNQPTVAGRELVQNAVDAVRARRALEAGTGTAVASESLRPLDADVVVTLEETSGRRWVLKVADRGIGMSPRLVVDYFLKAGASFGPTPAEMEEMPADRAIQGMKTGRFGVGAFAAYLLGSEIEVVTRHAEQSRGLHFTARLEEELVQIDWTDAPIGTEVAIPFDPQKVPPWKDDNPPWAPHEFLGLIANSYRLGDPAALFRLKTPEGEETLSAPADVPDPNQELPNRWRRLDSKGFDAILWRVPQSTEASSRLGGSVIHNGIVIREPITESRLAGGTYEWSQPTISKILRPPGVAVFDTRHRLGVALHRYKLIEPTLPFELQLLNSIGHDIVARALVLGEGHHPLLIVNGASPVVSRAGWLPPLPTLLSSYLQSSLLVLWGFRRTYRYLPPSFERFLAFRELPEGAFSHRMAVKSLRRVTTELPEVRMWGHTLGDLSRASNELARHLGARPLASVVVRKPALEGAAQTGSGKNWTTGSVGGRDVFYSGAGPSTPLAEELVKLGLSHVHGRVTSVAFTAYGEFDSGGRSQETLAIPWMDAVGDQLPHESPALRKIVEAACESDPALAETVRRWRQQA
jgi:molecular chaperone HtpG